MKLYELVKYRYGLKPRQYTAFCLTPAVRPPNTRVIAGKEVVFTNAGISSSEARHFQEPEQAQEWARQSGIKIDEKTVGSWLPLSGTGILTKGAKHGTHKPGRPVQ